MLFSWNFQFRENGKVVGEMERSLWRETAELDLDDGRYSFYRDQVIGGDYVIDHKGQTLARASKPSWWRSNLDVELFKRSVKLRRPSIFRRRFAVFEGGRRVGIINPDWITGRAKIDLPPDWTVLNRFSFLALLPGVEAATRLDDPDYIDARPRAGQQVH